MPSPSAFQTVLPVITAPQQQITFYADDPSSYKQILAVYNNYEFTMRFRITCTDCSKYTISVSQGLIKPQHSINLVVHHKAVIPSNIGISDTVRVTLYSDAPFNAGGKNDVVITLLASKPREQAPLPPLCETENFHQLEADAASITFLRQHPMIYERNHTVWKIAGFLLGLMVLCLPNESEESEYFPSFLPKPTLQQKFFTCYFLGILTALLIKT